MSENNQEDSNSSLFNNSQFKEAFKSLSTEDQEKYKKIGEELYGTIDFEKTGNKKDTEPDSDELVAYVINQLRSGIHPSDMEPGEKLIMEDAYGEEWYTKWGYVKEDLDDIVTTT
jgi:hypothetical protein